MRGARGVGGILALGVAAALVSGPACKPKGVADAEAKKNVTWLAETGSPEAVAALGRLADDDPKALAALQARAATDVNANIAAWTAVTRNAPWGAAFIRASLADPSRADLAANAMPRRDPHLAAFAGDLEGAVVRLAAGHRGSVIAGVLASIGPPAHAHVERRLVDPKTRGAMCDGIGLPEASGDAKSLVLAVPPEARDNESCVADVVAMADKEDVVLGWLATTAETGLLGAIAKSTLPCPRVATIWAKALVERPPEAHAALAVPLQESIHRCAATLDPVLADLLMKAPVSRSPIAQAIDPYGAELADLGKTCAQLGKGYMRAEPLRVREKATDALAHGCKFAH
jgi:hypothetical protein